MSRDQDHLVVGAVESDVRAPHVVVDNEIDAAAPVPELTAELRRLGVAADAFAAAFARARYGPPAGAASAAEETWLEQRKVLSSLRRRLGPGPRFRGFLAVRSLRGS